MPKPKRQSIRDRLSWFTDQHRGTPSKPSRRRDQAGNSEPKFKVGQAVTFSPGLFGDPPTKAPLTVTKVLPNEGRERQYRLKAVHEAFERVADEGQLALA